jgi:acyl-CoA synthetase (AMP-forming)/AMP-acid ligase II
MNIYAHISRAALQRDAESAFVAVGKNGHDVKLSYAQFDAQVKSLCAGLTERGIGKGDRVILLIPMQIELYVCMSAIMRIGAVTVFVDPHMRRDHFDNCCRLVKPKAFIGTSKAHLFRVFCKQLRKVPIQLTTGRLPGFIARSIGTWMRKPLHRPAPEIADVTDDHPALIGFTTGSSGVPRGSTRSHGFLNAQIKALFQPGEKRNSVVDLPGFPVLPLDNLVRGRTTILPQIQPGKVADIEVKTLLAQVARYSPDMMSGAPSYLETICAGAEAARCTLDSVKILFTGGAAMPKSGLQRLRAVWPSARVVIVYGSTEAEPVACIDATEIINECYSLSTRGHGYCVGYPIDEIESAILPLDFINSNIDDLSEVVLPGYCVGEIVVRGPHVNTQYWNDPQGEKKNKIQTPNGIWHRMGDAGYRDEKGRLWLLGRCHNAISAPWLPAPDDNPRSFNPRQSAWIFPYQVEAIINNLEGIKRSAYVGVNNGYHLVVEFVDDGSDIVSLETSLRVAITGFPLTRIWFQPLPVDPRHNSKIEYQKVIDLLKEQGA